MAGDYEAFRVSASECVACPLHKTRNQVVVDRGNPKAAVAFVGTSPGYAEDQTGQAFLGKAGKYLDDLIAEEDLEACFLYVLKCKPPGGAFPGDKRSTLGTDVVKKCLPLLDQQIGLISPKVVVLVGKKAAQWLLFRGRGRVESMGVLTSNWYRSGDYPGMEFFVIYHPGFLARKQEEDPDSAEEIGEAIRSVISRAADASRGKWPRKTQPIVVPSISFKRNTRQGTLF